MLSKCNGLYGDALSKIEMWLPATRVEAFVVPQHEGCRDIFELLFLSSASFVSLLSPLPTLGPAL